VKLLVVGFGVVGKAVFAGLMAEHEVDAHDPPAGYYKQSRYAYYDGIILCLPTPSDEQGVCDDSLVEAYWTDIRLNHETPILLKSTTSIELITKLKDDKNLTFNPEFLTEANSNAEFKKQDFAIFGGTQPRFWYDIFIAAGIQIDRVRFTTMEKAAYAKYTINCFLATKVIFFNQLREMYGEVDFDMLTELVSLDPRIGNSHMMAPGPDGRMGFGGMCFPKDTSAFAHSARNKGKAFTLLESVIDINSTLRNI
jgi:UDPglucose 6-dehydrogenase